MSTAGPIPRRSPRSPKGEGTPITRRAAPKAIGAAAALPQEPPMSAVMYQLNVKNLSKTISCRPDQTVLQACMAAGIDYPFACASGNCGACITQLHAGEVSMLPRADGALSPEQVAEGKTLACRARPRSDLAITWLGRGRR